jgi:hypothetical protein
MSKSLFLWVAALILLSEIFLARWHEEKAFEFSGTREAIWAQREREIARSGDSAGILFLGDSTVKNAIDPDLFYRLTQIKAMNLGLTGNLVAYGDYAVLKKYLNDHKPPQAIVVWHAIDVWPRPLDMQLFAFTNPEWGDTQAALKNALTHVSSPTDYLKWPVEYMAQIVRNQLMKIPSYRNRLEIRKETDRYLPVLLHLDGGGGPPMPDPDVTLKNQLRSVVRMAFYISPDMVFWFEKLVRLANDNHIRIFGAHAPIHEMFLDKDSAEKKLALINDEVNRFYDRYPEIGKLNTRSPVFLKEHSHGDKDHVSEAGRTHLTRYYADRINEIKGNSFDR